MEEGDISGLIALAVTGGSAALGWGMYRHKRLAKERAGERVSRARELGWEYDPNRDGDIEFRMRGTTRGIRWELIHDSDRSASESSPHITWRWRERTASRIKMSLMSATADRIAFGSIGRGIIGFARKLGVQSKSHPDGDDFYDHALKVQSGLTVFQQEWIVRARRPALFRGVPSHEIADLLMNWPHHEEGKSNPVAASVNLLFDHEGLKLECPQGIEEMAVLEHIVKLGCAVASKLAPIDLDSAV